MTFDVPVLLIIWRRPALALEVLQVVKQVAPSRIFLASDGWRNQEEKQKVQTTRELAISNIDWDCQIQTRFLEINQGCEKGPSQAISWFFKHVESGIILEDDCIPHIDFFFYCRELLDRYQDDQRIWCISGDNFQDGLVRGDSSYYFSRYNHGWGWATWKRCWKHYSNHLEYWEILKNNHSLQSAIFDNSLERDYFLKIWRDLFSLDDLQAWDYRWSLVVLLNNGLSILPNRNLVRNIGHDLDATHTFDPSISIDECKLDWPLIHPQFVCRDYDADTYSFDHHFGGIRIKQMSQWHNSFIFGVRALLKKSLKLCLNSFKSFATIFRAV